jgi:hypothetical protein
MNISSVGSRRKGAHSLLRREIDTNIPKAVSNTFCASDDKDSHQAKSNAIMANMYLLTVV